MTESGQFRDSGQASPAKIDSQPALAEDDGLLGKPCLALCHALLGAAAAAHTVSGWLLLLHGLPSSLTSTLCLAMQPSRTKTRTRARYPALILTCFKFRLKKYTGLYERWVAKIFLSSRQRRCCQTTAKSKEERRESTTTSTTPASSSPRTLFWSVFLLLLLLFRLPALSL